MISVNLAMARYISFPFRFQRDTQHDGLRHDLTKKKIMIQHIDIIQQIADALEKVYN